MLEDISLSLIQFCFFGTIAAFVLFAAAGVLFLMSASGRKLRKFASAPTVPIAQARTGFVKVHGSIQPGPGGAFRSPLTGHECVAYRIALEGTTGTATRGYSTETALEVRDECPFFVVDDTGSIRVDAEWATLILSEERVADDSERSFDDRTLTWLGAHGVKKLPSRRPRLIEQRLVAGETADLRGQIAQGADAAGATDRVLGGRDRLVIATRPVHVNPGFFKIPRYVFGFGCATMVLVLLAGLALGLIAYGTWEGYFDDEDWGNTTPVQQAPTSSKR